MFARVHFKSFLVLSLFCLSSNLFSENAIILKQDDAPLKITSYKNSQSYSEYSYKINHNIKYLNTSGKKIVVVSLGFVTFDAFNDFLGKFGGVSIADVQLNKETSGSWQHSPYNAFLFEKYGTGIVYVDRVRFEDGTFWTVNESDILPQIKEVQESFTADLLKEKKGEK